MVIDKKPFGYIYTITNSENGKVYVGKVEREKYERRGIEPLQGRWNDHVKKAEILKRKRETNPHEKFKGTHLKNAIIKYGQDAFEMKKIDTAYSLKELNDKERFWVKENDSMNPDKGYNMTEGGDFGRLRPEILQDPVYREKQKAATKKALDELYKDPIVREIHRVHTSEAIKKKWKDPEYIKKQEEAKEKIGAATRERFKDPEFRKKHSEATSKGMEKVVKDPKYRENRSKASKKMWQNPEYREKHHKAMEKVRKNPEYIKRQKETHNTPEAIEKQSRMAKERLKDPEFREKHRNATSKGMKAKWKDPEYIKKQAIAKKELGKSRRKEIENKRDFLGEVKNNMLKKDLLEKYRMGHNALTRRIQEMFGPDGPRNYRELKNYMRDRNVDGVLKEIEERNKEREVKPESQGDDSEDKGESKSQDNSKEETDKDAKSDEKEDLKEPSKEENEDNKSDKNEENSERNQNQENSDEKLREKGETSAEIEENIESKNKETMDEDTSEEERENNVSDSEESKSKDSLNSEEIAKFGKNVEDMEDLNLTVKDYSGIDNNSSEREQDIACLDKDQSTKNSESTRYINLGNVDIISIEIVKDIKTDENKDYAGIDNDSSKKPQYTKTDEESPKSKDSESIKYIHHDKEDIKSIVIVKDITADEEKDYSDVDEGAANIVPDFAFIDKFLDKTIGSEVSKSDKIIEGGKEYFDT